MMNETMAKLAAILDENNIPYEVVIQPLFGTPQICIPCADNDIMVGDFVCNPTSYGNKYGLLECLGFGFEDVIGYLNADRAAKIVLRWYNNLKREG